MTSRTRFLVSAAAVIAAGTMANVATAQEATTTNTSAQPTNGTPPATGNDIVVTATRRASSVQTTAASITALSADTLRDKGVTNFEDLGRVAPAVQVSNSEGFAQVYIRGIGTPLRGAGLGEASTAFLVDGIYKANAADAATPFFDVERVEVLAGPQGTLYGRNANSGAINVITADPTSTLQAYGRLTAGNYSRFTEQGAVSGPITDNVEGRIAFIKNNHDGYEHLTYPDGSRSDAENENDVALRGKLRFQIAPSLSFMLAGDYFEENDRAVDYHFFGPGFGGQASYHARYLSSTAFSIPYSRNQVTQVPFYNRRHIGGVSGKFNYEFDGYTLSSTSAYRTIKFQYQNDLGFTNIPVATQHHGENAWQFTEDLLLTSPTGHFFEWLVGGSYITQNNDLLVNYLIPTAGSVGNLVVSHAGQNPSFSPNDGTCCLLDLSGSFSNHAFAPFFEVTLNVTDKFKIKGGGRYTWETIGGSQHVGVADNGVYGTTPAAIYNMQPVLPVPGSGVSPNEHQFTPKVSVEYRFDPTVFAYASYTKGFKSGGFNIGDFAQNTPFSPETIDSYEVGLKTQPFNRKVTFNATLFDYQYHNLQEQVTGLASIGILNAATARVRGAEFDGAVRPWYLGQIDFSATWLDAIFTNFQTSNPNRAALGVLQLSGHHLPKAPNLSLDVGVQQGYQLPAGRVTGRFDWSHKATAYQDIFSEPGLTVPPTDLFSGRLSYAPDRGKWDVALFIENLTNAKFATNAFYGGGVIGSEALGQLNPPRTFGGEIGVKF